MELTIRVSEYFGCSQITVARDVIIEGADLHNETVLTCLKKLSRDALDGAYYELINKLERDKTK